MYALLQAFVAAGIRLHPAHWTEEADRYVVHSNPWRAMRTLGKIGYFFQVRRRQLEAALRRFLEEKE